MKILVLSSLYPPHYVGGYELGCCDVVEGLKRRGHTVAVLTSTYGVTRPQSDGEVFRWLRSDLGWDYESSVGDRVRLLEKEIRNRRAFRRLVAQIRPDLVYVWAMRSISLSLLFMAGQIGLPLCYFVSDNWLANWEGHDRWLLRPNHPARRVFKALLSLAADALGGRAPIGMPDLRRVQFASEYLKQTALRHGKAVTDAEVIHWGVDAGRFPYRTARAGGATRLLYVGQLAEPKGVHTAIEAFRLLAGDGNRDITLTIAGGTIFPEYAARLRSLVSSAGLEQRVYFTGLLPREQLPDLYQAHDILIFPSAWEEPFSITLLEALASGLAVVGTTTGGSAEILRHEINALVFPKEDAPACAALVRRLLDQPALFERVRLAGRQTVEQHFRIETMIARIEQSLLAAAGEGLGVRHGSL